MAGGPASLKEELEMSLAEELGAGNQGPSQEHGVLAEMMERGSRSLSASHRRQKLEPKSLGSATIQPIWNMASTRPKKLGSQLQAPRMSREQGHTDVHTPEYSGSFQSMRFHYERNPDADMMAEIGLEELNGLEMEVIRRQLRMITGRLRALEEQSTTWRQKETVFITMMVSACIANLWLWMRH
ncbi:fetal and adult testis-expressed transcript protein [Otolemur garnettii]|uniref:Fetal and adult testis expressed 1 n=1 Tax=Otolemur garnettii TaxID=30611 RepID=H0XGZ6_OTOGA|nr:fetal and adult testis-expressed transcript protein [Otolemur garnettii]